MTHDIFDAVRHWTFDSALPWWAENAADKVSGGFVEAFDLTGGDAGATFKRTRVACRQIYVFSHASLLGFKDGEHLIAHGADWLTNTAWMPDQSAFARRLTREGVVLDPTIDLYDHAFALFAFGWQLKATGDRDALRWAHRTLDAIEHHLAHPSGRGFWHQTPAEGFRQQNPHMHLTEAMPGALRRQQGTALCGHGREADDALSRKLLRPAVRHARRILHGRLASAPGEDGRRTEPGHQFEWAWILTETHRLLGLDYRDDVRALVGFAERHGVDPAQHTPPTTPSAMTGRQSTPARAPGRTQSTSRPPSRCGRSTARTRPKSSTRAAGCYFDRYLGTAIQGLWIDAFDGAGVPQSADVPSLDLLSHFPRLCGNAAG